MVVLSALEFDAAREAERQRQKTLFLSVEKGQSELCDVKLVTETSDEWIGSSKQRLREMSDVFGRLLQKHEGCEIITVAGLMTTDVLRALNALSFGQYDRVELTAANLAHVWSAAMLYECTLLVQCCEVLIQKWIGDPDRTAQCVRVIRDLFYCDLCSKASQLLSQLTESSEGCLRVWNTLEVVDLPLPLFIQLVRLDSLPVMEDDVWGKCRLWSAAQSVSDHSAGVSESKTRSIDDDKDDDDMPPELGALSQLKSVIRFPQISLGLLASEVFEIGILSVLEYVAVTRVKGGAQVSGMFCDCQPRSIISGTESSDSSAQEWRFDRFPKGMRVKCEENSEQLLSVHSDSCPALFACSKGVSEGVLRWTITVRSMKESSPWFGFGVTHDAEQFRQSRQSGVFEQSIKQLTHPAYLFLGWGHAKTVGNGECNSVLTDLPRLQCGDSLSLTLDCQASTLTALYSTTGQVHCLSLPPKQVYHPCVAGWWANSLRSVHVLFTSYRTR